MHKRIIGLIILLSISAQSETLITQSVAEVNSKYLSSRQVILTSLLSICLKGSCKGAEVVSTKIKSESFASQLSKSIFERLAYYESVGVFEDYKPITKVQLNRVMRAKLSKAFQFNQQEVLKAYRVKMLAKKYIEFKDKNLSVYITTGEARKYYSKNKSLYTKGDFKAHLASIKKVLQNKQKRKRVQSWVVNMQSKYRVKQFLN